MSTSDYPLLTAPGYELYQLAHLTSIAVDALARHRRAMDARDRLIHRVPAASMTSADAADAGATHATAFLPWRDLQVTGCVRSSGTHRAKGNVPDWVTHLRGCGAGGTVVVG